MLAKNKYIATQTKMNKRDIKKPKGTIWKNHKIKVYSATTGTRVSRYLTA